MARTSQFWTKTPNMKFVIALTFLILCIIHSGYSDDGDDVVHVTVPGVGKVLGRKQESMSKDSYYRFWDIPYGVIGDWFQPATEAPEQELIENTLRGCPSSSIPFSEDNKECLAMKIDSKNVKGSAPVMVYIPGLDLDSGTTATTDGYRLMSNDIVFVTLQYRVGAFGFLSTRTEQLPGNIGALDIILALKWIQKHISHFGGDPTRVTLFGMYKAAGLISALSVSPLAEGLFHRMILHSGSVNIDDLATEDALDFAHKIGKELGCATEDTAVLTKCLVETDHEKLYDAYEALMVSLHGATYPIIIGGTSGLLPGDIPLDERIRESKKKFDIIAGFEDHPAVYLLDKYNEGDESYFSIKTLKKVFANDIEKDVLDEDEEAFIGFLGVLIGEDTVKALLDTETPMLKVFARSFWPPAVDAEGFKLKNGLLMSLIDYDFDVSNIYYYSFKYSNGEHYFTEKKGNWLKNYVTLGDEFQYIFGMNDLEGEDAKVSELLIDLWTSFAETGKPESMMLYEWPKLDYDFPYLIVDRIPRIGTKIASEYSPLLNCARKIGCKWYETE